jgi:hypothetical protein
MRRIMMLLQEENVEKESGNKLKQLRRADESLSGKHPVVSP